MNSDPDPMINVLHPNMVLACLPYRSANATPQTTLRRTLPWLDISITGGRHGIAYGPAARLLLSHIMTLAKLSDQRTVTLATSLNDLSRTIYGDAQTRHRQNLKDNLRRLLSTLIEITVLPFDHQPCPRCTATMRLDKKHNIFRCERWTACGHTEEPRHVERSWTLASRLEFWGTRLIDPTVTLSLDLFDDIRDRATPHCWRTLQELADSPTTMDLFLFLTYRAATLEKPRTFTSRNLIKHLSGSTSDPDSITATDLKNFRNRLHDALETLRSKNIDYGARFTPRGLHVLPGQPIIKNLQPLPIRPRQHSQLSLFPRADIR